MVWRLARSLQVLQAEVLTLHPGTTVWDIGDADHQRTASDHNPNPAGVVCAIDVLGDGGMSLDTFAEHLKRTNHRAVKYVIYNRAVWSKARAGEGWRPYGGSNPHTGHVHVSAGVGPDGRSTGPYDDQSPWGLLEEDDMQLKDGIWIPQWIRRRWPQLGDRLGVGSALVSGYGHSRLGNERAGTLLQGQAELAGQLAGLAELVRQLAVAPPVQLSAEQLTALTAAVASAAREPGERIAAALAAAGQELDQLDEEA